MIQYPHIRTEGRMKILIIDPPGNLLGVNVGIAYPMGLLAFLLAASLFSG